MTSAYHLGSIVHNRNIVDVAIYLAMTAII